MPFVGLVSDPRWEPPEGNGDGDKDHHRTWRIPWRALGWVTLLLGLTLLGPVVGQVVGQFAGYLVLCSTVALGFWRFDKWCATQYWSGLRDYQS